MQQKASSQNQKASTGTASPGSGGDYDPSSILVRTAATVLILADRPDLQVLMLKRNARSVFVGDMWVFPGGGVDPGDASPQADAAVRGLTDVDASSTLDIESGGIAFWVAALRETFERYRDQINAGSLDFVEAMRTEDLELDGTDVHYVARWVTPLGPPRRYDTRFFVTAMPNGQTPLHDNDEAVHDEWIRPSDALKRNETDEMLMMTPTISMLQRLARFSNVQEAMASAANATQTDDEAVRIRYGVEGPNRITWPEDDDYEDSDPRAEDGTVRWPSPIG